MELAEGEQKEEKKNTAILFGVEKEIEKHKK